MIQAKPTVIELDMGELEDVLRRAAEKLDERDYGLIKAVIESYAYLTELVGDKDTTIRRLRQMFFGAKTEKTSAVVSGLKDAERQAASPETTAMPESSAAPDAEAPAKADVEVPAETQSEPDSQASEGKHGHGHNGAEAFTVVYHNDAIYRDQKLSAEERLLFHQAESGPTMEELHVWLERQLDQRRVEPNSALGKAMSYLLRHWEKLTLFLRVAGAPLDNNVCERALKKAIRHRRNSLFYKTLHGAHVGDMFMSLIATCELCGANPFDYLTELDRHADSAAANSAAWMPWNYRATLANLASSPGTAS